MKLFLIVLSCLLFSASALPVRGGLLKRTKRPLRLGIVCGFVRIQTEVCFAIQGGSPGLELRFRHHTRFYPLTGQGQPPALPVKNALRFLKRRLHIDRLDISAVLSLGDAAQSVLAAAILGIAAENVRAFFPACPLHCRIKCVFSPPSAFDGLGIVSCRLGDIMLAALFIGRDSLIKRMARRHLQWTSTPSKPS